MQTYEPTITSIKATKKGWVTLWSNRTKSAPHKLRYVGHGRFLAVPGVKVTEMDRFIAGVKAGDEIVVDTTVTVQ